MCHMKIRGNRRPIGFDIITEASSRRTGTGDLSTLSHRADYSSNALLSRPVVQSSFAGRVANINEQTTHLVRIYPLLSFEDRVSVYNRVSAAIPVLHRTVFVFHRCVKFAISL